ncbi:MAG: winged helix-turn-helix transcriptional regulator [Candidatus Lokiarchaeota archaeon]|nr:winged helix-turn-helix transcriptional regulator [Candidatus Lokiarchaeota archaeon]
MVLTNKDLRILNVLVHGGGKVSAEEISSVLDIPPRTVRYRLSRLKKHGYLKRLYAMTHERKMGLKHHCVIFEEDLSYGSIPEDLLRSLFYVTYYSPIYGSTHGLILHFVESLDLDNQGLETCKLLKERGIIADFHFYESLDYVSFQPDIKRMNKEGLWDWSHNDWIETIKDVLNGNDLIPITFDKNPDITKFDKKDLIILDALKIDGGITHKDLGEKVDLSGTQVGNRISHLESEGIIKGYRLFIREPLQPVYFYIFLDIHSKVDEVLSAFVHLPFPKEIIYTDTGMYLVRLRFYGEDIPVILRGFHLLKPFLKEYRFHEAVSMSSGPISAYLQNYDPNSGVMITPKFDYEKIISDFCESQTD